MFTQSCFFVFLLLLLSCCYSRAWDSATWAGPSSVSYTHQYNTLLDSATGSRIGHIQVFMGLSKRGRISSGLLDASWPLPEKAKVLVASLPTEDQEVLRHLVLRNFILPSGRDAALNRKTNVYLNKGKPGHRKVINRTTSVSPANPVYNIRCESLEIATMLKEARKDGKSKHKPTIACSCFNCYLSFWGKWNASSNRHAISDILDIVDEHVLNDPSWESLLPGPEVLGQSKGEERKCSPSSRQRRRPSNKRGNQNTNTGSSVIACEVRVKESFSQIRDGCGEDVLDHIPFPEKIEKGTHVRRRGLLCRIFPDALGGLAVRLWGLVSLSMRNYSMDSY